MSVTGGHMIAFFQDAAFSLVLAGALCVVSVFDAASSLKAPPLSVATELASESDPPPPLPEIVPPKEVFDRIPRIKVNFNNSIDLGRMGVLTTSGDPENTQDDNLKMTFSVDGVTSNTCVKVDGVSAFYGAFGSGSDRISHHETGEGKYESQWKFRDVDFTQTVEIVPGDVTRRLDTLRVTFSARNNGADPHLVASRYLIDTLIGGNDGVPFIVAGEKQMVTNAVTFQGESVPDFVRALQNPSLTHPGVIVDIGLRPLDCERPDEVVLSHWPGLDADWDYDRTRQIDGDSAAGLYFSAKVLKPGETRTMGFTYGLGSISSTSSRNSRLSLTAGGPFNAGGSFWLVALVQQSRPGTELQIKLPRGLQLAPGHSVSKKVTGDFSQASWLVMADPGSIGDHEIRVSLSPGDIEERQTIKIQPSQAKLSLRVPERVTAGKPFWVSGLIRNPRSGPIAELILPAGFTFVTGHSATKPVMEAEGFSRVDWLIKSDSALRGNHRIRVHLTPDDLTVAGEVTLQIGSIID